MENKLCDTLRKYLLTKYRRVRKPHQRSVEIIWVVLMDTDDWSNPGPIGFALGIRARLGKDGTLISYSVQTHSNGLSEEIILTIMRHWLRSSEDDYHEYFLSQA